MFSHTAAPQCLSSLVKVTCPDRPVTVRQVIYQLYRCNPLQEVPYCFGRHAGTVRYVSELQRGLGLEQVVQLLCPLSQSLMVAEDVMREVVER